MDISTLKAQHAFVNLQHPATREDLGLVIEMRPRHSKEVQRVNEQFEAKHSKRTARGKEPSAAERRNHSKELISAAVVGWEWTDEELTFNGEQPDYSADTLKSWMKDYPWILEQLSAYFVEDENFFTG